jgi:glyoxylate reductase
MEKQHAPVKVFLTRDLPEVAADLLRKEGFEVEVWPEDRPMTAAELIEHAKNCNALLCTSVEKIDAHFLNECSHLDIISQFAAGYDNIDLEEATRLGIPIGNAPAAMSKATADIAFGLMIAASRKMFYMHKSIAKGEWGFFRPKAHLGIELTGKTLGVFGLGKIGMEMAKRCKGAYDMDIIYCNRKPNPDAEARFGARLVDFETLLRESDVLSVHAGLSPETKGLFNRRAFQQMKPSALFINTSRGAVHNEQDLIDALRAGEIWGAGLDVTNPEPMHPDNPLLSMENVAVLPHIGSATVEARNEMARVAAQNLVDYYRTGVFGNWVNGVG